MLSSDQFACMVPKMPLPLKVTCVLSPSSLKLPSSKVPSSPRPRAALAVGAVLCRLHAYACSKQAIKAAGTSTPGAIEPLKCPAACLAA